ncbi:MAG: putative geranylgeranyl reductase [Candidatus Scalindua rubra]|uniref:Putative geranylgeranyl reductase n=1 Tax=Candidatus Scalindua rubra TaxID=1872076 RepID=A0A1E3XGQ0_9BACT|nr:MAG: putative geranylgeranyl reductase [Candidatus Scalindua rubra]
MIDKDFFLNDGSQIAIIGGGPAGSFFAHFASKFAKERGINVGITIFEGKSFHQKGPRGCNMCGGVISEKLYGELKSQEILIPERCIQREIDGYHFQTQDGYIEVHNPRPSTEKKIVTVYRGDGPMFSQQSESISFDNFLLSHVENMGVNVCSDIVSDVVLPSNTKEKARVIFGKRGSREEINVDLVVGAFGLNTGMLEKMKRLKFGYIPPRTIRACQAEIYVGNKDDYRYLDNKIHIFSLGIKSITYASFTPKEDYITVSLIGKTDLNKAHLIEFLNHPIVRRVLPEEDWKIPKSFCICFPRINITQARHPFTDRFVIIGSAAISRYFKNGIESAFSTSKIAADSIFELGVSEKAFWRGYHKPVKKLFGSDNSYGRRVFGLNDYITSRRRISSSYLALLKSGKDSPIVKKQLEVVWNMCTGSIPYKKVFLKAFDPILQFKLMPITLTAWTRQAIESTVGGRELRHARRLGHLAKKGLGPLEDGQTVVIIGGGPAGTSCAITLSRLAKRRNIDLNIVLYEGKDFGKSEQFNPCVGVLSPPIEEILEKDLGIPFPHDLVLEEIPAYYLHSDDEDIKLEGDGEVSLAVRRIYFDNYLIHKAKDAGVNVLHSRVTNTDIEPSGVMVYSENDNRRADVVVGAFGLDEGACKMFETTTRYRTAQYLSTILTKFYPEKEEMEKFGNSIHAFLPSLRGIEFGAITPKIDHLDINIAGSKVNWRWMDNFLLLPQVNKVLPPNFAMQRHELSYSRWQFPTSPAKNLFGDRYVTVGDAAGIIRAFKGKGVNTACITGIRAAEVMMDVGISREAFKDYYDSFSEITGDLPYGKTVRRLATFSAHYGLFSPMVKLAKEDKTFRIALFDSVAGSKMFKRIIFDTLNAHLSWKITKIFISWFLKQFSFMSWLTKPVSKIITIKRP